MARLKLSKTAGYLRYAERKLAEASTDEHRAFWQSKVEFFRAALAGRCTRCGRELQDKTATVGPECARLIAKAAS